MAARAEFGLEPWAARPADLDRALEDARPRRMARRDYIYALFDVGARHCRAAPVCGGYPLRPTCHWDARDTTPAPSRSPRRQAQYAGSMRQLRGAVLHAVLAGAAGASEVADAVEAVPAAADIGAVSAAIASLIADGLVPAAIARGARLPSDVAPWR